MSDNTEHTEGYKDAYRDGYAQGTKDGYSQGFHYGFAHCKEMTLISLDDHTILEKGKLKEAEKANG